MTVYSTLLAKVYFPKELPPAFFTAEFANYAANKIGRATLSKYKPRDNFTECVKYQLARPGFERRELRIPHPATFAKLAELTAKNLALLLKRASASKISRSRPVYSTGRERAISPMTRPPNLTKERAVARAGSAFLLRADISQFYPSLYTHAVGWAVNPQLRHRANWNKGSFLGKELDQALMNLDGKVSQGIPIGNDISFLLSELVLARVDKALTSRNVRAFRWYDDYELAVDTREQAEECLRKLNRELGKFRLRLNPKKTKIFALPIPSQEHWQSTLRQAGSVPFRNSQSIVQFFDTAFRLRDEFPEEPVLLYALGLLFKIDCPSPDVGRVAQSCITQSLLCEPGAAQKAFALLTYWAINGFRLDSELIANTVNRMIVRHQAIGFSSDIAWALSFCLDREYVLSSTAGKVLSGFDDDCIALQALDMEQRGLLPKGFKKKKIIGFLRTPT